MRIFAVILVLLLSGCSSNPFVFMGTERKGYVISVEKAIEIARPHLYESFKLRNPSTKLSEVEYSNKDFYQTFVYLDREKNVYVVFKDLPRKMYSQHFAHPVRIDIFSGKVLVES